MNCPDCGHDKRRHGPECGGCTECQCPRLFQSLWSLRNTSSGKFTVMKRDGKNIFNGVKCEN